MKRIIVLIGSLCFGSAVMATGHTNAALDAALVHANAAIHMDNTQGVHLHLHHVINCLVGPQGKLFDAKAEALSEHPCKDLGAGALAAADHDARERTDLQHALAVAQRGIAAGDMKAAHADAGAVLQRLQDAQRASR